jgi:hypothetical protein
MDANKDELRRSLRSQQTQLALQRALIAPIRRICDDIIHEIFLWVVPQVTEVFDDPSYQYRLAATCQKWREIALSTPFLWTCLALFSPKGTSRTENACSRLQTLIARVGSCQVDIDWFRSARDDRAGSITIAATNYLLSSVPFSRWKSLRINNYDAVDPWSPSTLDGRYGQFEALEFLWLTAGSGCDKLVTRIASFEPPNLRHLKIDTLDDIVHQKYARFGHSLLILDLSGPDFENYGVLNSLQALSLEELPRAALQLPQLKRLSLQTAHVSRLEKSVTPLIESLSIERLVLPKHDQCVLAPTIKDLEVSAHCLHDLLDFVTPNIDRFLVRKTKLTAAEVAVQVKPFSEGDLACQPKILAIAVSLSLKDTLESWSINAMWLT